MNASYRSGSSMKSRWSRRTSIACRLALSTMNSVRVFPSTAAASSTRWRVRASMRRLMLSFVSEASARSPTAAAPGTTLSDEERRLAIPKMCAIVPTVSIQILSTSDRGVEPGWIPSRHGRCPSGYCSMDGAPCCPAPQSEASPYHRIHPKTSSTRQSQRSRTSGRAHDSGLVTALWLDGHYRPHTPANALLQKIGRMIKVGDEPRLVRLPAEQGPGSLTRRRDVQYCEPEPAEMLRRLFRRL